MFISSLELKRFRSYNEFHLEPDPALNVLVGPNAIGKTNAIEAIQILASGRSFRSPRWQDVVQWGAVSSQLSLTTEDQGRSTRVDLEISSDGSRRLKLNGNPKRGFSSLQSGPVCVIFTPDDLGLAKGPAENRRSAIDDLGEQLSKTYGSIRRDYAKTVRQRNALLREERIDPSSMRALEDQLVKTGGSLLVHRLRLLDRVSLRAREIHDQLANGERLDIKYEMKTNAEQSSVKVLDTVEAEELLRAAFERRRADERKRMVTLVGPHRDDIVFEIDGADARTFASQGQQRTVALSWKWAEIRVIEDISHTNPILLLDDVMSELDTDRREALADLAGSGNQAFITTTNTGYFNDSFLEQAKITSISAGERS